MEVTTWSGHVMLTPLSTRPREDGPPGGHVNRRWSPPVEDSIPLWVLVALDGTSYRVPGGYTLRWRVVLWVYKGREAL